MPRVVGVDDAGVDRTETIRARSATRARWATREIGDIEEIHDGETIWRFDRDFLQSRWTCLWGRGCEGIGPEPAAHLGLGCCSVGAELGDVDEARMISALAATLAPEIFERPPRGRERRHLRRRCPPPTPAWWRVPASPQPPGFRRRCRLCPPLGRSRAGESPRRLGSRRCARQLPIRVDWEPGPRDPDDPDGEPVQRWRPCGAGPEGLGNRGRNDAWCCTEGQKALRGRASRHRITRRRVQGVVGTEVYVELRRRMKGR